MGHTVSSATREKIRAATKQLPVAQFTTSGERLRIFPSITAAAQAVGLNKGNIWAVCQNQKRTARGYVWRYADSHTPETTRNTHGLA